MIRVRVDCYAGYKGDERPIRFGIDQQIYRVECIEDQWYSPSAMYFRVRADDGNIYVLRHDQGQDDWTLEAFRAAALGEHDPDAA